MGRIFSIYATAYILTENREGLRTFFVSDNRNEALGNEIRGSKIGLEVKKLRACLFIFLVFMVRISSGQPILFRLFFVSVSFYGFQYMRSIS